MTNDVEVNGLRWHEEAKHVRGRNIITGFWIDAAGCRVDPLRHALALGTKTTEKHDSERLTPQPSQTAAAGRDRGRPST